MSSIIKIDISKKELENLYWSRGFSTRKIAAILGRSQRHAINLMKYYGILRRERIDAVIKGCKKYEKTPFSGDLKEKAYMMGLAFADFRRRMHGRQIDISLSTTHPTFARLFKEMFAAYSPVHERPYYNKNTGKYGWCLDCNLHPTFDFLLGPKAVPDWIKNDDTYFLHFFAGYTDGEGTITVSKNSPRCIAFILRIMSSDKEILTSIYEWMKNSGLRPSIDKFREKGDEVLFYDKIVTCSNDHWAVRLKRKNEVISLLRMLPLRHEERIRKRECMLKLKDFIYQKDVSPHWQKLRDEINSEVKEYVNLAERRVKERVNPSSVLS